MVASMFIVADVGGGGGEAFQADVSVAGSVAVCGLFCEQRRPLLLLSF